MIVSWSESKVRSLDLDLVLEKRVLKVRRRSQMEKRKWRTGTQ